MTSASRARLVLSIVETDTTFRREEVRGERMWVGRCIFCQAKLSVPLDGEAPPRVTVEHIVPRHHGGTDDAENLALACAACNGEKGRRHDNKAPDDPRRLAVTRALLERRKARWPASARPPVWPTVDAVASPAGGHTTDDATTQPLRVARLMIYPLKSAAGIAVEQATAGDRGFEHDRRFMLINAAGTFLSQRQHPAMALIQPGIDGSSLRFSARSGPPLAVPLRPSGPRVQVRVWGDECEAVEVDDGGWFRRQLGVDCRLVHMPDDSLRPVDPDHASRGELVSFADTFPFLLVLQASIDRLSRQTGRPLSAPRFRPNIVVSGGEADQETTWNRLRIGKLSFVAAKPCTRCKIVNIDPETALEGDDLLPALRRPGGDGKARFGQHLLAQTEGIVRVGDPVEEL